MKKVISFLSVFLLALLGSTDAVAQLPAVSDNSNTYLYYIHNVRASGYFVTTTNANGGAQQLGSADAITDEKQKVTFKVVATSTNGQYNLVATNVGNNPLYAGWSGTDGANTVQLYASTANNTAWIISAHNYDSHYGVAICPSAASGKSWNMHGAAGNNIGLYNKNDGGGIWMFVPADQKTYDKMIADAQVLLPYGSSTEIGKVSSTSAPYTALQTAVGNNTFSDDNAKALALAYSQYTLIIHSLYLPTGYYTMTGLDAGRGSYLYNDYTHAGNAAGYTLAGTEASTKNNYVWKITNNGTNISIVNGQGTPMGVGAERALYGGNIHKYSTLNFASYNVTYYNSHSDIAFTEGLDQSDKTNYNLPDGTSFITTWAGNPQAAECRFAFTPVEGDAYTVSITGTVNYISEVPYITHTSTGQIALNGGFMLFASAPAAGDFSYTSEKYNGVYTVNTTSKTITLTLTPKPAVVLPVLISQARELLTNYSATQVGYPKETARTVLQDAIDAAEAVTEATDDDVNTLTSAIQTYKATTDVNLPENGKVYTIKLRKNDKSLLYLYRQASDNDNLRAAAYTEGMELPNTAYFVCRYNESITNDYKYSFVPAYSAGYLCYQQFNSSTFNEYKNCAYIKPMVGQTSNNHITDRSVDNLFGYLFMTFNSRNQDTNGDDGCIIYKTTTSAFDNSNAPYLDGTFTSALVFEEVDYPNNVTLNPAVGIDAGNQYIATFSAPFATVVPEGVTAYIVSEAGNTAKMTQFATTGQAIPANTGVLLYGSATNALMVPATSETQASIADGQSNKLIGTAGAAKNMEDVAGAYILGKPADADKVAFYLCSGGTLGMNKAYLDLSTSGAAALEIDFGGEATGLTNLNIATEKTSPIYDLSGRRVMNVQKGGLYIQNGKKFIVK